MARLAGQRPKVLLLGGTSHTGKSTTAARLASRLGWRHLSTDQLARHPGRPWRVDETALPTDVVDYFSSLSPSQLLADVLDHYRTNVWPIVEAIVRSHLNNAFDPSLILEGSAILPEPYGRARFPAGCEAVWLTCGDAEIRRRVLAESRYERQSPDTKRLVDAFLDRALRFNAFVVGEASAHGYPCLESGEAAFEVLLQKLSGGGEEPGS